jgi:rhodanese-related sulfurtransferase
MKNVAQFFTIIVLFFSCSNANSQRENLLSTADFEKRLHAIPDAQLIDVRSAEEFNNGHLKNAINMNVNNNELKDRSIYLDKEKPLFVYCYSGGRSAKACDYFRKMGFKIVYDMKGGYSAWVDDGRPVEGKTTLSLGMRLEDFNLLTSQGKVLVDVNAPWCAPCLKMKPILDSLDEDWKGMVKILRINKDENALIAKSLEVQELPALFYFEDGKLIRREQGFKDAMQLQQLVFKK